MPVLLFRLEVMVGMNSSRPLVTDKYKEMLESCMCLQFRMTNRLLTQFYDEVVKLSGVRVTQLPILVTLALDGPTSVNQLAKRLLMDRTTLGQNVKPLEARGIIAISPGADRRTREIKLTSMGSKVVDEAIPLWEKAQKRVVEGLGERQSARLLWDLHAIQMLGPKL